MGNHHKRNGEWGIAIFQTSADELEGSLAELLAGERLRDGRQGHRRPLFLGLRVAAHPTTAVSSSSLPPPPSTCEFVRFDWNGG